MNDTNKAVAHILSALNTDSKQKAQAELYKKLRDRRISLKDFFVEQKRLDTVMIGESEKVFWKYLKRYNPCVYNHEKKHKDVWKKYGVKTSLFNWTTHPQVYFVSDLNFSEVVEKKQFDVEMIVSVYKEMLLASFKDEQVLTYHYLMDVFFFEVLNGLDDFNENGILNSFTKYTWHINELS